MSAEVVMGAHRESAMKASEAFRLSQVSSSVNNMAQFVVDCSHMAEQERGERGEK